MEDHKMDTNHKVLVLQYGALASKELTATNSIELALIAEQKKKIEENLGMSGSEIIVEASNIVVRE